MGQERRIFGPPGCGKTELLARTIIPQAVEKFGNDKVLVCSLTKTGARTIAGRAGSIDQNNVGTIHKICYRALGTPKLVVEKIKDWNTEHPEMAMGDGAPGSSLSLDEGGVSEAGSSESVEFSCDGEKLMSIMNILRSKLVPKEIWPEEIIAFKTMWDDFKEQTGTCDFTDLIENAILEVPVAPRNPNILVVDEAQDTNPLQLKLLRSWASVMEEHIFVGDDDQTIYEFAGCTAEAFLNPPIADRYKKILKQSYRVPERVHMLAQNIIKRVTVREPKEYFPRRDSNGNYVEGSIGIINSTYRKPDRLIEEAYKRVETGKSVMILTSCAYMLEKIRHSLVVNGIPFENEFRRRRGDWNPLHDGRKGVSTKSILKSFLDKGPDENFWTVEQLVSWAKHLSVGDFGLLPRIGNKAIEALEDAVKNNTPGIHSTREVLAQVLGKNAIVKALERNTDWLMLNLKKQRINAMKYPISVVGRFGVDALDEKPKITIGTIHSVKGGEADCVFIAPDISKKAFMASNANIEDSNSVNRLFYVGVTRAREEVILLKNETKFSFRFG